MEQYTVTGMSCAACSARVEKAVKKVPGVTSCAVSLLTNSMGVEGSASPDQIISAVTRAGYGASLKGETKEQHRASADASALEDKETPKLRKRLISSLGFLAILMYFSMGHMMWGWPLPGFFHENHIAMGLLQMLLAGIVMVINQKFFINGFKGLIHRSPNMDTLVALGSMASYVWSVYALFMMTRAQVDGNTDLVMHYMMEFYFESAAMILTLITVGKMLEARSKGRTTDALKGLMNLSPKTATVLRNDQEVTVGIEQVRKGDRFVVRPGEVIPVDGVVLEGSSAVNEAALSGESIPVDKEAGDLVSAATLNQSGFITCEATRVGEDTTLSQIIKMVRDAAATKAPIAKIADQVSGIFVPVVLLIMLITTAVWMLAGKEFGFALARGISVLVISCPCALGLATPVAIMVGNGMGAKNGILFKTAASLEAAGNVQIVALDKTGTITLGEPKVTDILPTEGTDEKELLSLAYSLEKKSEHPLAKAIIQRAEEEGISAKEVTGFQALAGNGLTAVCGTERLTGGSMKYIQERFAVSDEMISAAEHLAENGKTPLFFVRNTQFAGIIAVADVMKQDSPSAIAQLRGMGIRVVMLTGDNEKTARAIGKQAGVDDVVAGVLPDGKEEVIRALQTCGKVAMVGDGINDAPALTRADIGIAIGAGTDVAIDAADIVLMKSALCDVPAAIRLSRATLRNIRENLFWAFFYNVIGIPLAAGVYIPLFGWTLNPMFGAAAMSLSSFCVVSNALRLNLFQVMNAGKDRKGKPVDIQEAISKYAAGTKTEEIKVDPSVKTESGIWKVMRIDGMMCEHCEATVQEVLETFPQVSSCKVSHQEGTAVFFCEPGVSQKELIKAVEAEDYTVVSLADQKETIPSKVVVMKISGMMCEHCEATVKEVLEAFEEVDMAEVSHEQDMARVCLNRPMDLEELKKAVEAEDYEVVEIVENV